jgi:hypothetical protein
MSIHSRACFPVFLVLCACGGQAASSSLGDSGTSDDRESGAVSATSEDGGGETARGSGAADAMPGPVPAEGAAPPNEDASVGSDCPSSCEAKAMSCGAPSSAAGPVCEAVCAASSSDQACLFSSSCASLTDGFANSGTVCGVGCAPLCQAKATSCGALMPKAIAACQALCGQAPTPAQAECLLSGSCQSLQATFVDGGTVCGVSVDPAAASLP